MQIVVLLAVTLAALVPSSGAVGAPQQPAGGRTAAAQVTKSTAATAATQAAASKSEWQSGVGEWVGAPCRIIVQKDDGRNFEADCFTPQGLHHPFHGTYTSANLIEGTVTRIDPSGCEVPVPMSIHITDANHAEYTHPGFTGCGVNNAGPAAAWPISRAQPVAISSPGNAAQQSAGSASTAAAKPGAAKPGAAKPTATPATAAKPETAKSGPTTRPQTPALIKTAAAPVSPKSATRVKPVVGPTLKPPVELPLKDLPAKAGN